MGWAIKGQIKGLAEVLSKLRGLGNRTTQGKILRKAVDAATKPMLATARALVRRRSGLLAKSLGRKIRTYRSTGRVVAVIGPRTGHKRQIEEGRGGKLKVVAKKRERKGGVYADPVRYAHLVELGTKRSRAYPFLRPAFRRHAAEAGETMRRLVLEGIAEALR